MKTRKTPALALAFFSLAAFLFLVACPTSDEPNRVLNMQIDKDNDSLLHFDSLIVTVYSKDSSFSYEVFHGVLRDPKQVSSMPLDSRVGSEYTVSIIGYKGGKVGVNKVVTILGPGNFQSKDLIVQVVKPPDTTIVIKPPDTVIVTPSIPEIMAPSDTSVVEGDSLRFRVSVRNPWIGASSLTLKDAIPGAALDTAGRDPGDSYFTWRPSFSQGRTEAYAVTFVYAAADKKVEKITRVKVLNLNRPPKLSSILDQKVKENETLSFKVEASDPDHDSITLTVVGLPDGATFAAGTFTWKPSMGQVGNYPVKFRAFDGVDSDLVATLITVGNVDVPQVVELRITSPARDTVVNFTPIIILYTVNGVPLQRKVALKDGKTKIFIDTTIGGRTALDTISITLDTVPPGKPVVAGASPVRIRTPTWTWASGGGGNGIYRYRLDVDDMSGSTLLTETSYTASKDQDLGAHTLFVQERDAAGNWSASGKYAIRIDTTRPAPPQLTVTPTSPTNNPLPTWNWIGTGDDFSGLFRYKLDTNDFRSGAIETRLTHFTPDNDKGLKEGSHVLYVQQQDSAGNWSNAGSAGILLDFTPPSPPKVNSPYAAAANSLKPTWTWTSGGGGNGTFRFSLDSVELPNAAAAKITSFIPLKNLSEESYTLFVQERDEAGNWSSIGKWNLSIDVTPPKPPKVVLENPTSPTTNGRPTWTWTSGGEGDTGIYAYVLDTASGAQTKTTKMLFTPTADLPIGKNTLYVREQDKAGNLSEWGTASITISQWSQSGQLAYPFAFLTVGTTLFAGADDGVFISTNAGESWTPRNSGIGTTSAYSLIMNEKKLLAGTAAGFIASQDSGRTWITSNSGMETYPGYHVSAFGANLYAGTPNGVFFSSNNGVSWEFTGLRDTSVSEILVIGTLIYAATVHGIFLSTDMGESWGPMNTGLPELRVTSLVAINSTLFAGTYGGGVFASTNSGVYWVEVNSGLTEKRVNTLVTKDLDLIAGTNDGVFLSRNKGQDWIDISAGIPDKYVTRLAVHGNYLITCPSDRIWRFFLE